MTRRDLARLEDITDAAGAIADHLQRGDLSDGLVYDAVRVRLIEIGEAVKGVDPELLAHEQSVPWRQVARMRDHLAHRYFDTDYSTVQIVVDRDLQPLVAAVERLTVQLNSASDASDPGDRESSPASG